MTSPNFFAIDKLLANKPRPKAGHVWLAIAGPGDPALLTLAVLHALR